MNLLRILGYMSRFFCLVAIILVAYLEARAQFVKVEVGVDGFTCSMCANSVETSVRQLVFVKDVKMDLNNGIAVIYFRENKEVSIHKIADKIYDAGFSVRYIHADYNFSEVAVNDYSVYKQGSEEFHFIKVGENIFKGVVSIIFLNKSLISKKEYTRWEGWIKEDTRRNGKSSTVYYVTLLRGI